MMVKGTAKNSPSTSAAISAPEHVMFLLGSAPSEVTGEHESVHHILSFSQKDEIISHSLP